MHDAVDESCELHHRERGGRDRDGQHDGPTEIAPARAAVGRERERAQRPRGGTEPGPGAQADEHERADAGGHQAGQQHHREHRSAEAGRLDHEHRADHGRAEDRRQRREASRRGHQAQRLLRRVPPKERHCEDAEATAQREQGRLRPQDKPEAERREGREENTRQIDRAERRSAGLEPVRRYVPAVSRQPHDRERGEETCECKPRQWPPDRDVVVAEVVWQRLVDLGLDLVHRLEEEPRGARHDEADQGREDEQHVVPRAADQRLGVGRQGCGGRGTHGSPRIWLMNATANPERRDNADLSASMVRMHVSRCRRSDGHGS